MKKEKLAKDYYINIYKDKKGLYDGMTSYKPLNISAEDEHYIFTIKFNENKKCHVVDLRSPVVAIERPKANKEPKAVAKNAVKSTKLPSATKIKKQIDKTLKKQAKRVIKK